MKSKKIGTFLLIFVMLCTVILSAGCEKDNNGGEGENNNPTEKDNGQGENKDNNEKGSNTDNKGDNKKNSNNNNGGSKKTVTLLKRNGVEWKENTKIKSKVGAKSYKVVWGDTLSLIARTWHVNCYRLARYNKIKNIDLIEVDQVIYNPAYKSK